MIQHQHIQRIDGNELLKNFKKLKGFDLKWSSLLTSTPLMFEDINYYRIKKFIDERVTKQELKAYKNKELRKVYTCLDSLLMCNLKYYDRIINYCTMVFLRYVDINGYPYSDDLSKVPYELTLTPTKIWCAVCTSEHSTKWELEYGWDMKNLKEPIDISNKSILEVNYEQMYKYNNTFKKFQEYNAIRLGVNGFRNCWLNENVSNNRLGHLCKKFTKTSNAISEHQLSTISEYCTYYESVNKKLYKALYSCLFSMFEGDDTQFSIFIFSDEFTILTSKFSLRVSKKNNKIQKDYLANSYECFLAEKYLIKSIDAQIEWSKIDNISENAYNFEKDILKTLLENQIERDYKDVVLVNKNRFNNSSLVKVTFTGIFNNVKINEQYVIDNRVIKTDTKVLSKTNAAKYLIERGYYLFGTRDDIDNLLDLKINKQTLIEHYSKYCIPVIRYMGDAIMLYERNNSDIINVLINGEVPKELLNNQNIKYINISQHTDIDLNLINLNRLKKINKSLRNNKKSYWKVVNE